jgi:acetyl-CoA C-acetyltransferase
VSIETILAAPIIAEPLGVFDCCGVSDGAACAIVTTPDIARALGKRDLITVKALQISASSGRESGISEWDGSCVPNTKLAARAAYHEAGITDPSRELTQVEVHDCFSITELVTMEDLGLSEPGGAVTDVLNGKFDADGALPCQTDGGLKCFGHPVGASGLRMVYEHYVQMMGRAGERQLKAPRLGLSHNLGGVPYNGVAAISIVGLL